MTAQTSDQIWHRGKEYSIVGVSGEGMFKAEEHGLHPVSYWTSCWSGYYCHYEVIDGTLRLKRLHIGLFDQEKEAADRGEGPVLFGLLPKYNESAGYYVYDDFPEPVPFSGSLSLGTDFIQDMYDHMGFQPFYKFREVLELTFEAGQLVDEADHSASAAQFRESMKDGQFPTFQPLPPPGAAPPDEP